MLYILAASRFEGEAEADQLELKPNEYTVITQPHQATNILTRHTIQTDHFHTNPEATNILNQLT